jgi:hypothetical protein
MTKSKSLARIALFGACAALANSCWHTSDTYYPNGQLMVLPGDYDASREREGVWVYFESDGTPRLQKGADAVQNWPSGFYQHGEKVRELTKEELDAAVLRAKRKMENPIR